MTIASLAIAAAFLGLAGVVAAQPEAARDAQPEAARDAQPEAARDAQPEAARDAQPADIECRADETHGQVCAVDRRLFVGFLVYTRHCASCHGAAAEGSAFAPDLRRRLRQFDEARFAAAMRNGYTGPAAPLEPWANRAEVAAQLEPLWAYLEARALGRLPGARIEVK